MSELKPYPDNYQAELERERQKLKDAQSELRKLRERVEHLQKARVLGQAISLEEAQLRETMILRLAQEEEEKRDALKTSLAREESELREGMMATFLEEEEELKAALAEEMIEQRRLFTGQSAATETQTAQPAAPEISSTVVSQSEASVEADAIQTSQTEIATEYAAPSQAEAERRFRHQARLEQFFIHLEEEINHMDRAVGQHKHAELLGASRWISRYASVLGLSNLSSLAKEMREADLVNNPKKVMGLVEELRQARRQILHELEEAEEHSSLRREKEIAPEVSVTPDEEETTKSGTGSTMGNLAQQRVKFLDMMPKQLTYLEEAWFERDEIEFNRICVWIMRYSKMLNFSAILQVAEKVVELDWQNQASQVNFQLRMLESIFDNTSLSAQHIMRSTAMRPEDGDNIPTDIPGLEAMVALRREKEKEKSEPPILFDMPDDGAHLKGEGPEESRVD